ncbi:MAG: hypothetical protein ACAI43_18540 [Phycisphaerae bacterium]
MAALPVPSRVVSRRRFVQAAGLTAAALALPRPARAADLLKKAGRTIERKSKATITPFGLNHNDTLRFTLAGGTPWEMTLLSTSASITERLARPARGGGDIAAYAFECLLVVNGNQHRIRREVGTQASFYEPTPIDGVNVWFDAASCAFKEDGGFMAEKDWTLGLVCQPSHKARFVVHETGLPVCPDPIGPWYPNPANRLDIRDCYDGKDCWMGPYQGASAHCGLDINMKAGTILSAPIAFDDHYLFHSTAAGFNNNRWRGVRRWPDGSEWWLQAHHLIKMLVPERTPLRAGTPYATTAGVMVGLHQHSHFILRIIEQGGDFLIDPWILFWESFRQAKRA